MQAGYIYALTNKSFGDYVIKIGMTRRKPYTRAKEIYVGASGVPEPFDVAFACQVSDCAEAERKIHERLKTYRSNKKREFFTIPIEVARKIILKVCQEVNKLFGSSVENLIVIDSGIIYAPDLSLEDICTNDSSECFWISINKLMFSALPGRSSLSNESKERIEVLSDIFRNTFPDRTLEDWVIDFSRDSNPQSEIVVWENIAKAFLKVDQVKYVSKEQKKEALFLLLMRSMMSASKVLEKVKLKTLCKKVAKEILRGYEANPKPISVVQDNIQFR
ncbi:hypothetical protein NIES4075_64060 [Tolypothrix sp. NIES-4075]|uniref:GIY-YIG nuclease family protein n=1 Tax=Tolypothrix sp. NIES-4075 TaxID=2005459 RepID=UPI000B5CF113|nr:GIY-YIG nuclease family protein [Tolypothrix sp. NIES-4075]GAX45385.1 hypothetical protein NIES4075_64060 [Tolypothrix sp. NIES-4075]